MLAYIFSNLPRTSDYISCMCFLKSIYSVQCICYKDYCTKFVCIWFLWNNSLSISCIKILITSCYWICINYFSMKNMLYFFLTRWTENLFITNYFTSHFLVVFNLESVTFFLNMKCILDTQPLSLSEPFWVCLKSPSTYYLNSVDIERDVRFEVSTHMKFFGPIKCRDELGIHI